MSKVYVDYVAYQSTCVEIGYSLDGTTGTTAEYDDVLKLALYLRKALQPVGSKAKELYISPELLMPVKRHAEQYTSSLAIRVSDIELAQRIALTLRGSDTLVLPFADDHHLIGLPYDTCLSKRAGLFHPPAEPVGNYGKGVVKVDPNAASIVEVTTNGESDDTVGLLTSRLCVRLLPSMEWVSGSPPEELNELRKALPYLPYETTFTFSLAWLAEAFVAAVGFHHFHNVYYYVNVSED